MALTEHQIDLLVSMVVLLIPSVLLLVVMARWACRARPIAVPSSSMTPRRSSKRRPRCGGRFTTKPVLFLVQEPRAPHSAFGLLFFAIVLRQLWFLLYYLDVAPANQCLSGLHCYPQVLVTFVNRLSQLSWFVAASKMPSFLGFAANARAWTYEPGPGADEELKAHVESLPVYGWPVSHLAIDLWLVLLQAVTLTVTIFVNIEAQHAQPLYYAYLLQTATLYIFLGVVFALAGLQHRKALGRLIYVLLDRATCRVVLGPHGCLFGIYSLLCPGRASSSGASVSGFAPSPASLSKEPSSVLLSDASLVMGPRLTSAEAEATAYFRSFREDSDNPQHANSIHQLGGAEENKKREISVSSFRPGEDSGSGTDDEGGKGTGRARSRSRSRSRAASSPPPPPPRPLSFPSGSGSGRNLSRSGGDSSVLDAAGVRPSRSGTAATEDSLTWLLEHDHSGPYALFSFFCLIIAVLLIVKGALFAYTPLTEGGQISGLASEIVWPWFYYVIPEGLPVLIFLHLLLRGGLFSCRGWKCRPSSCGKKIKIAAGSASYGSVSKSTSNGLLLLTQPQSSKTAATTTTATTTLAVSFTTAAASPANSARPSAVAGLGLVPMPAAAAAAAAPGAVAGTSTGSAAPLLVQVGGRNLVVMGGAVPTSVPPTSVPANANANLVASSSSSSRPLLVASPRPSLQPPL